MSRSGVEYGSFGVCWNESQKMDCGVYYFENSHLYASYYPTITCGHTQLYNAPPKYKQGDVVGIIVDLDNKIIEFLLNESSIYTTELKNKGEPIYLVCGMFCGTLEVIN